MSRSASRAMRRVAAATSGLITALLAGITACTEITGAHKIPSDSMLTYDSIAGLNLSAPVPALLAAARRSHAAPRAPTNVSNLVYISLAPGSVPTGQRATIRDLATGGSVTTGVLDGGFDPVSIQASVGDSVVVEIERTGADGPMRTVQLVTASRPPVMVRTQPPHKKVDVPLNSIIVVVFSVPIDSATLSEGVQLWNDTARVSGMVRLNDSAGFRVEFHPDSLLAIQTAYDLIITQSIHDLNGESPASSMDVQFSTGVNVEPLAFTAMTVADGHTCALTASGAAYCWGINTEGQLGTATGLECGERCSTIPAPVDGGLSFQTLSAGTYHTCGLTASGTAYCWGSYGRLGADSATRNACSSTAYAGGCPYPVPVAGGLTFKSISAGHDHTCGVTTAGAAYCWGSAIGGELGVDSATVATKCQTVWGCSKPVPVSGGITFTSVSAGNGLSCGVTAWGAAWCWGTNRSGELGIGTAAGPDHCGAFPGDSLSSCSLVPVAVASGLTFSTVTALTASACGLTTAGIAYCWGINHGLLGSAVPPDTFASRPVRVGGELTFTSIAGGLQYVCAVTGTAVAVCWGDGDNGVLGDGTTSLLSTTPGEVAGGHTFQALSTANGRLDHTCGLTTDGVAYCWGSNVLGELGNGSTNSSVVPVPVVGQQDFR